MAKFFTEFNEGHLSFIQEQKMFFVGTAPLSGGNVNVSPKGYHTLRVLNPNQVIYADYNGSGNETATHLSENQRITFMWCSFANSPLILRGYGKGIVITKDHDTFAEYLHLHFPDLDARVIRQLFVVDIESVQTSCGFGVPIMSFVEERDTLIKSSERKYITI
ncbi:pyridoxamine 5'-phosphate oxidase family protein [Paenibacillus agricola]|uniref:Pyridoxamine 5'-phosphate oxidase family protein n=1 Tax=Paenibacillus agricola TaxID=2716264 RepID=A0ABX0JAK8_9BACL|nr:pyridoxamine 5'-phosphate oxidase family protein [Paenibacillus agricola]NHN31813.1 pyridoxamine 5'-phosphate oxidase family protein [Paenibacillus agricola]